MRIVSFIVYDDSGSIIQSGACTDTTVDINRAAGNYLPVTVSVNPKQFEVVNGVVTQKP